MQAGIFRFANNCDVTRKTHELTIVIGYFLMEQPQQASLAVWKERTIGPEVDLYFRIDSVDDSSLDIEISSLEVFALEPVFWARRDNPPLQRLDVRFLATENDQLIAYSKGSGAGAIIVVVNLDPHNAQEGVCTVPWEVPGQPAFTVRDLMTDATFAWQTGRNYVRLEPALPAHVLRVAS